MLHHYMQMMDPVRDPAWRANRALELVESGARPKQPTLADDEKIREFRRFLMEWRKGGESRKQRLCLENPGLFFAYRIHQCPDPEYRAIVEAKILAREPDDYIAADISTCSEAIPWYHDLFFDVRERMHSRMYITKCVLGPSARRIPQHDDVMTDNMKYMLYKSFGYFGGPLVLDTVITGYEQTGTFPAKSDQVADWFDSAFKTAIRRRASMAAQVFTVDRWKVMELLQMHVTLLAQQQAANAASGGTQTEFHQNIEMFFDRIPMAIGRNAQEGRTPEFLAYEKTGVEPRASEMLLLAEGEEPDPLKGKLDFQRPVVEDGADDQAHG